MRNVATRDVRLDTDNVRQALTYLDTSPYENVFLTYVAIEGSPTLKRHVHLIFDGDQIVGVGYFGRQVVLASEETALGALATIQPEERVHAIVAPVRTAEAYWDIVRARHPAPRLVRERQPVMAVDRESLVTRDAARVHARPAREDEWAVVADNSAAMIAGELQTDPRQDEEFASGIRRMIRMRLWWVGESEGRLCFFCNIGAWSPRTAQLQGIWTPPELRGRGLATAALGLICGQLLRAFPTLSLYVNDFNRTAVALYQRLGFRTAGALRTILF